MVSARALLIACVAVLLVPSAAVAGSVDFVSMSPKARRAALRQAHAQTVLMLGNGVSSVKAQQHMLDHMKVPTARGRVVLSGPDARYSGAGWTPQADADRPANGSPTTLRLGSGGGNPVVFDHEMGHAFDYANMTDAARAKFMAYLRYKPGTKWWGDIPGNDPRYVTNPPPGEQFGDIYRILAQHADKLQSKREWNRYRSNYGVDNGYLTGQVRAVPRFYQARKILKLIESVG